MFNKQLMNITSNELFEYRHQDCDSFYGGSKEMKDVIEIFYVLSIIFTSSIYTLNAREDKFNKNQSYTSIILRYNVGHSIGPQRILKRDINEEKLGNI